MTNFVIDITSVNDVEIRTDLETFIASRPDADRWDQFFQASSGQLTVEMVVSLATWLKYDSISSRRENYLQYALTRGGIVAGGQQQGYSVNRGRNAILSMTFTPATTGTLPKWHVLGTVKGSPIVLLDETIVNTGVPVTVSATIGDILNQELTSATDKANTFRFTEKRVSEDVQIYIDGTKVDHSDDILDLVQHKFFLQTNALGALDAKYLNQDLATTNYLNGSIIKLEWIELKDLSFVLSDISLDETDGVLTAVETTSLYDAPETNQSIKVNAPLQNETKFTIRGRNDFSKLLLVADPDFIAAGGRDTAIAAVVEIFALRDDLSIPDSIEKQALLDAIILNRPFGVQPPIIIDAAPNFMDVSVSLTLDTTVGDTTALVRGILASFEKKLSTPEEIQQVDFIEIEKQMTESDLVKISRIFIKFSSWLGETSYRRGIHIEPNTPNGFIYEAIEFNRYSGPVEPTWPTPVILILPLIGFTYGQTVEDNSIIWETIATDNTLNEWTADSVYKVGDSVNHLNTGGNNPDASFRALEVLHRSGTSLPALFASIVDQGATYTADIIGTVGNTISLVFDGVDDVDTVTDTWNLSNPANTVAFTGVLGTFVPTVITVTLAGGFDAYDAEPSWPIPVDTIIPDDRSFIDDNQVLWLMVKKVGTPLAWASNTIYRVGESVIPNTVLAGQENMMWQMASIIGITGDTEPTFSTTFGDTVIDNEVTWATRNKLDSPEEPNDNEYYLIDEDITVS
jgi:hypothetical protein